MQAAEHYVEQAVERTGLDDFGDDDWRAGLDRLLDALEQPEARLTDVGTVVVETDIAQYLDNRLGLVALRAQHPELADGDVARPIVVIGQARTGTTILHDLLAQDPASRVPLSWEVDRPLPPPDPATYDTDTRIEETANQQSMIDLLIPHFRAMHPVGPQLAQECVRITGGAFRSMIFPTQYRVPSYGGWLIDEADLAPAYRWHRLVLQHLQSRTGAERWVLKSPGHLWALDALMAEYPDALLIQTHRDPLRIIASVSSLMALLREIAVEAPTMAEAAEEFADYIVSGLDRSVDARERGIVGSDRVVDVSFRDFMSDQIGTIGRVYDALGLELTSESEKRMRTFLDEHPQDKHGLHTYTWEDTGLDAGEWRERTKRYEDYFGVEPEF